jgi:hypothetical protein
MGLGCSDLTVIKLSGLLFWDLWLGSSLELFQEPGPITSHLWYLSSALVLHPPSPFVYFHHLLPVSALATLTITTATTPQVLPPSAHLFSLLF